MLTHMSDDNLHAGSPMRRPAVTRAICIGLCVVLALAGMANLGVLPGLGPEGFGVFDRAVARSSVLSIIPLSLLWFLDRRERESPWLFASAFLWGGCIATGLAVPFNTV